MTAPAHQMRLTAVATAEGFAWQMGDEEVRVGHGTCATLAELRGVEIRSGVARVEITGALTDSDRTAAADYGWHLGS